MRVSSYAVARPQYYDRNATSGTAVFSGSSVAPHVETVRWTVTVATGKKANIELTRMMAFRVTAATVAGTAGYVARITTSTSYMDVLFEAHVNNTVGYEAKDIAPAGVTLYAGETLDGRTYDGSTLGVYNYLTGCKFTTFDA